MAMRDQSGVKYEYWRNAARYARKIVKLIRYYLEKPFYHILEDEDSNTARIKLNRFSKCPVGTSLAHNHIVLPFRYDLQIIVPAYNVEKWIKECLDSILSQETRYSYCVFVIDDGSTDSTGQIIDQYCSDDRIYVIHQENKGFSGARNAGLSEIIAEYIMFVDSDDRLMSGAIERLMDVAKRENADIVQGGMCRLKRDRMVACQSPGYTGPILSRHDFEGFCCGKVFQSALFSAMRFPEGFWFEDSIISFLIYPLAHRIWIVKDVIYAYRDNTDGITHTARSRAKCVDTYWVTELLVKEHDDLGLPKDKEFVEKILRQILLNAKRVSEMPDEVQRAIFILTVDLLKRHFLPCDIKSTHKELAGAIERADYGAYKLYCSTH